MAQLVRPLFNSADYSDVRITVGNTAFYAHRFVLVPQCKYFEALFDSDFKEAKERQVAFHLPTDNDIPVTLPWNASHFEVALRILYCVPLEWNDVDYDFVVALLDLSEYLCSDAVKSTCDARLTQLGASMISLNTWAHFLALTKKHSLPLLHDQVLQYIKHNAHSIFQKCDRQNLLCLDKDEFEHLVIFSSSPAFSHRDKLALIRAYVSCNWEERLPSLPLMLRPLLLHLASSDMLELSSWLSVALNQHPHPACFEACYWVHDFFCAKMRQLHHSLQQLKGLEIKTDGDSVDKVYAAAQVDSLLGQCKM
jgi:hypothetical protein